MNKKLDTNKVLTILVFILIGIINFWFSIHTIRGTLQCKHDNLINILKLIAKWLHYIVLVGGIIFVVFSKYKSKNYYIGIKVIILVALIIPFILSTCSYFVGTYDEKNNNCIIGSTNWKPVPDYY